MNYSRIFADDLGTTFSVKNSFLRFLRKRAWHNWWQVKSINKLHFVVLDKELTDVEQAAEE